MPAITPSATVSLADREKLSRQFAINIRGNCGENRFAKELALWDFPPAVSKSRSKSRVRSLTEQQRNISFSFAIARLRDFNEISSEMYPGGFEKTITGKSSEIKAKGIVGEVVRKVPSAFLIPRERCQPHPVFAFAYINKTFFLCFHRRRLKRNEMLIKCNEIFIYWRAPCKWHYFDIKEWKFSFFVPPSESVRRSVCEDFFNLQSIEYNIISEHLGRDFFSSSQLLCREFLLQGMKNYVRISWRATSTVT